MLGSSDRLTVARERGFVVFLVGARVNRWWMVPVVWGVATAMRRMLRELANTPDSGLLSYEEYNGRTTLMVQYWESLEHLHAFAHAREREHTSAWRRWIEAWGATGAMGIWHETYVVAPGTWECVYNHMPAFGLGKVGPLVPAEGALKTAAGRLKAQAAA